jgi:uncharacterized membrane protein (UPF0127 family)
LVKKIAVLIPVFVAAIIVGSLGLVFIPQEIKNKPIEFAEGTIKIDDDVIKVEIAESPADRQRWLMFREEKLPLNSAMILIYEKPDLYAMWLLNIEYNLDLIWVNENGNIVYMVKDAAPCKNTLDPVSCTYKNTKPAKYVIAAVSGFIEKHEITEKSLMTIISI